MRAWSGGRFEVAGGEHLSLGIWRDLPKRWSAFAADHGLVDGKAFQCYEPEQASYDLLIAQAPGTAQLAITLHAEGVTPRTRLFPINPAIVQAIGEVLRAKEEAPWHPSRRRRRSDAIRVCPISP